MSRARSFAQYAHPERLVSTQWLADRLGQVGTSDLAVVESDEDVLLYETGHIPGAVKIDWHLDLNDPRVRDYVDGEGFARLLERKGISRDTTVVIYGDRSNWWAAYALWVFTLFGHRDVRLLDGGRDTWIAEGRELTIAPSAPEAGTYPTIDRDDSRVRAFREDVTRVLTGSDGDGPTALVDIRSPQEYTGERLHMPDYPEEGALRGGHIPTARNAPWAWAVDVDGTFKPRAELRGRLRRRRPRPRPGRAGHHLLPDRRTLEPHLVRAHPPARLRLGPQLRRLVDRVGQRGTGADRGGGGAWGAAGPHALVRAPTR